MSDIEVITAAAPIRIEVSGAQGPGASVAVATHAATSKATPVDADEIPLADSAESFGLKKLTWANLKATVKAYFDTIYAALVHTHVSVDVTDASDNSTADVGNEGKLLKVRTGGQVGARTGSTSAVKGQADSAAGGEFTSGETSGIQASSAFGLYHAFFGTSGDNRAGVARLSGLFTWFRGAFKQTLGSPSTLSADSALLLPTALTGTLALTAQPDGSIRASDLAVAASDDIGVALVDADEIIVGTKKSAMSRVATYFASVGRTLSGAWAFSSTTRPTSSGTGTPASNSLITLADGDGRYGGNFFAAYRASNSTARVNDTTLAADDVLTFPSIPVGVYEAQILMRVFDNVTAGFKWQLGGTCTKSVIGYPHGITFASAITGVWGGLAAGAIGETKTPFGSYSLIAKYHMIVNVTVAGSLWIEYAQQTSSASGSYIQGGAFFVLKKLN